jgi:hypothetical protein
MEILTDKELDFLKEEAKKIKAIDYLKEIAKKHDLLFPDSNKPEEKKRLLEDHNRRKKATNKALKLVSRVDIDIVEEGIYEPKNQTLKKEYCVLTKIICKSSDPEDQVFTEVTLGSGINFFLSYTIDQILQERLDNYRTETEKKKKAQYKRSGHLVDQRLQFNYPKDSNRQLSIFDSLTEVTKEKIKTRGIWVVSEVVIGIKLTGSESKVIDSLCKLFHKKSESTFKPTDEGYYLGNVDTYDIFPYGGEDEIAPRLGFTLYELCKEYKGEDKVGGKDIENVKNILYELDKKEFLIRHEAQAKTKGGGKKVRTIEEVQKLIKILSYKEEEFNEHGEEISRKQDMIISLNSIFRYQIDTWFIPTPDDINERTILAYGSHNVSEPAITLRDYLMRELARTRYTPQIRLEKLYYLLSEKMMKESRKNLVKQKTQKALETVIALGLLESYEIKPGATGEQIVYFKLNKDWE